MTSPFGFRHDLPRWQQLVTPAWVAALLAGDTTVAAPAQKWRLLEVGFGGLQAFRMGHIPGAGYLDTAELEHGPLWNKVPDATLLALLLRCGIRHDTTVILYGKHPLAAARAAHLMLYAGVRDVRLLDGGYAAWTRSALAVEEGPARQIAPAAGFGSDFPARPDYLADMRQVKRLLHAPDACLASIRTWNEFIGKTSGYSYIAARGEIPGARWGRAGSGDDVNSVSQFHDAHGRMIPAAQLACMWSANGIRPCCRVVFYCGTGWRASLAFFYAWLMGWERISVYDGGWCEWSRDPANPVVCLTDVAGSSLTGELLHEAQGLPVS